MVCAWGWASRFATAPALGAVELLAADEVAVELLFELLFELLLELLLEVPLVAGVEDAELLSASDLCASWVEDESRSPVFAVLVAVLAAGTAVRSGKRLAVCGGRLAVARAVCPSGMDEVRSASAAEVESFFDGVEAAVVETGAETGSAGATGTAAGVRAMLAAVAGEELTAACTAAAIAACCVSVAGWPLAAGAGFSVAADGEELQPVEVGASEALTSATGGCVAVAGVAGTGVAAVDTAGRWAGGASVPCEVAAAAGADWVDTAVGASVEAVGLATGSIAGAISVAGFCEVDAAPEPDEGTGARSAEAFRPSRVSQDMAAFSGWAVPVTSGSTAPFPAAGATGTALDSRPGTTVLVAAVVSAVDPAGKALAGRDACLAGDWPRFWTEVSVAALATLSVGCTSCAIMSWFAGCGAAAGGVVGTGMAVWVCGICSVWAGCFVAVSLPAVFFSVDFSVEVGDEPALERALSTLETGCFTAGALTAADSPDAWASVSVKLEVGSEADPCTRRDAPDEGEVLLAA